MEAVAIASRMNFTTQEKKPPKSPSRMQRMVTAARSRWLCSSMDAQSSSSSLLPAAEAACFMAMPF